MRVAQVRQSDPLRNETCVECKRRALPGQVVLVHNFNDGPMTRSKFVVHARCMRKLLESAPQEADEQAFIELKTLIHATREAFPE